jgi:hypothetical protein
MRAQTKNRPLPKNIQKILEKPYSVKLNCGDVLYFSRKEDAHAVSRSLGAVYSVFLLSVRAWVPVGIIG